MKVVITCQPDELHPERAFRVVTGSIIESSADLVVVSAHADGPLPADAPVRSHGWGGAALAALVAAHGETVVTGLKRYAHFEPAGAYSLGPTGNARAAAWGGVWAAPLDAAETPASRGRWLLVVRAPGALDDEQDALPTLLAATFGVVAAIAANRGAPFRSVALSNLFADRPYGEPARVEALLRQIRRWYAGGMGADVVDVVLYDRNQQELTRMSEAWAGAVRAILGWVPVEQDPATIALRREVRDRVAIQLREDGGIPVMNEMLRDLYTIVDPDHPRTLQEIARAGRSLAEAFSAELCHSYGLPYKAQAFSNLEALTKLAERDSAVDQLSTKSSHVARWIVSYLHTLRTLGNEASHVVQERGERFPTRLEADDLIVLLSQVRRVLDFRLRWRVMRATSS